MEGIIKAVCISEKRGTVKKNINEVNVIKDFGLEGDAHAGKWHRQVSFLSADIVDEFNEKGASVIEGDFGENILAYGIDFKKLPVGTKYYVRATDLENFVDMELSDGRRCRLAVKKSDKGWGFEIDGVYEEDCFEFIPYAG